MAYDPTMKWHGIPRSIVEELRDAGVRTAEDVLAYHEALSKQGQGGLQHFHGIGPARAERILEEAHRVQSAFLGIEADPELTGRGETGDPWGGTSVGPPVGQLRSEIVDQAEELVSNIPHRLSAKSKVDQVLSQYSNYGWSREELESLLRQSHLTGGAPQARHMIQKVIPAINEAMDLGLTRQQAMQALAGSDLPVRSMGTQKMREILAEHAAQDIGRPVQGGIHGVQRTHDQWRALSPGGRARDRESLEYKHRAAGATRPGYAAIGPRPSTQFHLERTLGATHWAVREGTIHTGLEDVSDFPSRIKQAMRAYESLHFADRPVEKAGWTLGPTADVPETGQRLRTAILFGNLLPEGQVAFSRKLGHLKRPGFRTVKAEVPHGFDVEGLARKGAQWLRDDDPFRLFKGHTGVSFPQWDYAKLHDIAYTPGEGKDPGVVRAQFELGKSPGRIFGARTPMTKGGGFQADLDRMFGGAFSEYDVVMSGAPRDRMGLAQMVGAAIPDELFEAITGQKRPGTWAEVAPEATGQILEWMGKPRRFDIPVLLSEDQLDWYRRAAEIEGAESRLIGEPMPAPGREGHYWAKMRYYGYDLPAFWTMTGEGAVEWGEHFIPPETLRMFERHAPETAAVWHEQSAQYKESLAAIIRADLATTGRGAALDAPELTGAQALQMIEGATEAALVDFPEGDLSPSMRANYILGQIPDELDYLRVSPPDSERDYFFPHPRHMPHVPGDIEGEELSPYRSGFADIIRHQAEMGAGLDREQELRGAVTRTFVAQHEQAWAPETRRKLLGVRPEAMWGGTFTASTAGHPGDVWMPTREAAMVMGRPTKGPEFERFSRRFEAGRLEPHVWTVPYPTITEDPAIIPSVMRWVGRHPESAMRESRTPIFNPTHVAAKQRDVDTDDILIARAYGLTPEEVRDRRQQWIEAGGRDPSQNVERAIKKMARFSTPQEVAEWLSDPITAFSLEEGVETLEQDALARMAIGYGANIRQEMVAAAPFREAEEAGRHVGAIMQQQALGGKPWGETFTRLAAFRSASLTYGTGAHTLALEGEEMRWLGGEMGTGAALPGEIVRIAQGLVEEGVLSEEAAASLIVPELGLVGEGVEVLRGERHITDIGGEGRYTLEGIAHSSLGGVVIAQAAAREGRMSKEVQEIGERLMSIRKSSRARQDVRVEETLRGMYLEGGWRREIAIQAGYRPPEEAPTRPESVARGAPAAQDIPEGLEAMFRPSHMGKEFSSILASAMGIPTAEGVAGTLIHEQVGKLLGIPEEEVRGLIAGQEMTGHLDLPIHGAHAFVDLKTGNPGYMRGHSGQLQTYSELAEGATPYILRREMGKHGEMRDLWRAIEPGMGEIQRRVLQGGEQIGGEGIGIEDLPARAQERLHSIAAEIAETYKEAEPALLAGEDPGSRFIKVERDPERVQQEAERLMGMLHQLREMVPDVEPEQIPAALREQFFEGELPQTYQELMSRLKPGQSGAGGQPPRDPPTLTGASAAADDPERRRAPGRASPAPWMGQITPRKFEESLDFAKTSLDAFSEAVIDLESGARQLDKSFLQGNKTFLNWASQIERVSKGWGVTEGITGTHRDDALEFLHQARPQVAAAREYERYGQLISLGQQLGVTPPGVPPSLIPPGGPGRGGAGGFGGGAGGFGGGMMRGSLGQLGWGLFNMRRAWMYTGGQITNLMSQYASYVGTQQQAMAAVGIGEGYTGLAGDVLHREATMQRMRLGLGESAWENWGWAADMFTGPGGLPESTALGRIVTGPAALPILPVMTKIAGTVGAWALGAPALAAGAGVAAKAMVPILATMGGLALSAETGGLLTRWHTGDYGGDFLGIPSTVGGAMQRRWPHGAELEPYTPAGLIDAVTTPLGGMLRGAARISERWELSQPQPGESIGAFGGMLKPGESIGAFGGIIEERPEPGGFVARLREWAGILEQAGRPEAVELSPEETAFRQIEQQVLQRFPYIKAADAPALIATYAGMTGRVPGEDWGEADLQALGALGRLAPQAQQQATQRARSLAEAFEIFPGSPRMAGFIQQQIQMGPVQLDRAARQLQQWGGPLRAMGLPGMALEQLTMPQPMVPQHLVDIHGLPQVYSEPALRPMQGPEAWYHNLLMGGDQRAWSELAMYGGQFPGTDYMMPATPELVARGPSGLPIGVTTPTYHGLTTGQFRGAYELSRGRMAEARETGSFIGGWPEGSMWGIQDAMTTQQRAYQDIQFGIQGAQAAAQRRHYQQIWPLQDQMRELGHVQQIGGTFGDLTFTGAFDWQRRQAEMGLGFTMAGIGLSRQDLALTREQQALQQQFRRRDFAWQFEDLGIQYQQALTQRGWTRDDWTRQRGISGREFGWRMEDYEEDIRFAEGRQRQRLITEQERDVIRYADERTQFEEQRSRQEEMWRWEDQAHERRLERLSEQEDREEQLTDIQDRRLAIQEERINQQEQQALASHEMQMEQLVEREAAYLAQYELETEIQELTRKHQLEMLSLQEAAAGAAQAHAKAMRQLEDDYRDAERAQRDLLSEWERLMIKAIIKMLEELGADTSDLQYFQDRAYGTERPQPERRTPVMN